MKAGVLDRLFTGMGTDLFPCRFAASLRLYFFAMSELNVPLQQRYASAWQEISQRIGARQSVYLQFATVSATALAGLASIITKEGTAPTLANNIAEWGSAALVAYTWAFSAWIRHNEALIGLLGAFCQTLELSDDDGERPAWHTESRCWILLAREYRKPAERAASVLAVFASLPALSFAWRHFKLCQPLWGMLLSAVFVVGLWAAWYLWSTRKFRERVAGFTARAVCDEATKLKLRKSS
jgi:hypothetical protein